MLILVVVNNFLKNGTLFRVYPVPKTGVPNMVSGHMMVFYLRYNGLVGNALG